jgi:hypothetical protein
MPFVIIEWPIFTRPVIGAVVGLRVGRDALATSGLPWSESGGRARVGGIRIGDLPGRDPARRPPD